MKRKSKMQTVGNIILRDPTLLPGEILKILRERGTPETRRTLYYVRNRLKNEGHKMPSWVGKEQVGRIHVILGSNSAAIMQALYQNPRAKPEQIVKTLAEKGIKCKRGDVNCVRSKMKNWFWQKIETKAAWADRWKQEIDFSIKPEPIKLTKEQQKKIPEAKRIVRWYLFNKVFPSRNWRREAKKEFREFVEAHILEIVKNHDKKKLALFNYIAMKIRFLLKEHVREELVQKMGITREEARLLIKIIREDAQGNKEPVKIAKKISSPKQRISKQEVRELWKAYNDFRRQRQRSIQKKEY